MTLTNHLKKTFERILKKLVVEYLEPNKVMNPIQQRYRNKRSTISQILSSYEDIISKLENGDDVDVIYLDFSKVFLKVDHNILLHKIKGLNVTGKILNWPETYLKKRQQRSKLNGQLSD